MKELNFESGLVTYSLNGKCEVSLNPTDAEFVERFHSAFSELEKKQEGYKEQVAAMTDGVEIFEFAKARDTEMRGILDGIFETPICDALFGSMNVYAMAGGLPVWCNLMLAILDEIESTMSREQKNMNPRIAKYTAKYQKYRKK